MDRDAMREAYARDGYIAIEKLFDSDEIERLRDEATAIVEGERGEIMGTDLIEGDGPTISNVLAIHFPHKASPVMLDVVKDARVADVLTALIGPDVKCMQSMLFAKNAGKPGQAWHQDEHYIATRDRSLCGVWIALDDATVENGCLWMHPGSHKHGILWPTKPHGDPRFDSSEEAYDFPYECEGGVAVEVPAGSVVFFDGYVLHRSLENTQTEGFRRAIVNHYMNARSYLPWTFGLPPAPHVDVRDFVLVAGEDPYAWKGKEEITFPFVRPEDPAQAGLLFQRLIAMAEERKTDA
ncbi:MAG: phytanoyl-CoA dioxygenase family protein [Parasphingopyxis sp.]|uniref:phytanoyl-CoA dioxygenase family protein n=1 Tax=Parasphingopyxis sp. TaxID=1920299 RepID=UPI003FA14DA0